MTTAANHRRASRVLCSLAGVGPSDADLLVQYADARDEGAFAELVRRHGPLVLRACRHVLGETTAAEDAFQATFLLLAQRARRVAATASVGGWLHTVAVRTARDARRTENRRRRREQACGAPLAEADDRTWRDVRELLDAELAALPEKYRLALVLCYLQELSYETAACRAGCSVGALRGWLERGKKLLRKRLARHGLPSAAPLLVLGRPPTVPTSLVQAARETVRAGLTGGCVAPAIAGLVGSSLRRKAVLLASSALLVAVVGLALVPTGASPTAPPADSDSAAAEAPQTAEAAAPRTDALGDPLPPGAVMRLGTRRYQVSTWPLKPVSLVGGKEYLVYHRDATASARPEFRWMDAATGKITASWALPVGLVAAGISRDGRWALLTGEKVFTTGLRAAPEKPDRSLAVTLFDLTRKQEVKVLRSEFEASEGDMASVHGVCFAADGKWLATVNSGNGNQGRVRLWNVESGTPVWASEWGKNGGPSLEPLGFTADDGQLILRSYDNRIHLVSTSQGKEVRDFPTMPRDQSYGVELSPDGTAVLLGAYAPDIRLWDVQTGKELPALTGHKEWARMMAFTPDGKTLVTGGNDAFVLVRDWPSGKVRKRIDLGRGAVGTLSLAADGRTLNVLFWWERTLQRYDLDAGQLLPYPGGTHHAEVYGVETAPDGTIVSLGKEGALRKWDGTSGRQTHQIHLDPMPDWLPFALSPDGQRVAAVNYEQSALVVYDRATGAVLRKIPTGREWDRAVFSADGKLVAATGRDAKTVRVWDTATGQVVFETPAKSAGWWAGCPAIAFSPDGRYFVATNGEQVRFWTVADWKPAGEIRAALSELVFSSDGRSLAGVDLNDVTVWEVATRTLRCKHPAHRQCPIRPRFSADGRYLAWQLHASDTVEVWDMLKDQLVTTFRGHDQGVTALTFTPDSRRLVTASDDCTLLVWDVTGPAAALKDSAIPDEKAIQAAWDDLGSANGERAFAALRTIIAAPGPSVALIRDRLKPAVAADAEKVRQLLDRLGSDQFEVRDQATKELAALGDATEGHLRKFLAGNPLPEAKRRAEGLLEARPPERLQRQRAVEALERMGTAEVRELLQRLAKGDPDASLTREVTATLRRLEAKR